MSRPVRSIGTARAARGLPINGGTSLRSVMGRFATGVTVLTVGGDNAHGMTANAFSSVSLDPPLVMCCVARGARLHSSIVSAGSFGVSILSSEQQDVSRHFADWRRSDGMAQFEPFDHRIGRHTGAPLLEGALAWLECELTKTFDGGDHSIFVGKVLGCGLDDGKGALSFFGGDYHLLAAPDRKAS